MKKFAICMFFCSCMMFLLGCSGRPPAPIIGKSPDQRSGEKKLASSGGSSSTTNQAKKDEKKESEKKADDSKKGDANDNANEDKSGGGGALLDDTAPEPKRNAAPPKPNQGGVDIFGRPLKKRSLVGGSGGGQAVSDTEVDTTVSSEDKAADDRNNGSANGGSDAGSTGNNNPPSNNDRTSNNNSSSKSDVAEPTSFIDLAEDAFARQQEVDAFQYLYAHVLVDKNALRDSGLDWYYGYSDDESVKFNEPRLALRWGVGIVYDVDGSFEGDPPVIGDAESDGSSGSGNSGGNDLSAPSSGNGMSLAGPGKRRGIGGPPPARNSNTESDEDEMDPHQQLAYYTGDYGKLLLERLEMRRTHEGGFYGKILADIKAKKMNAENEDGGDAQSGSFSGGPVPGGDNDLGMITGGSNVPQGPQRGSGRNDSSSSRDGDDKDGPKTGLQPGVTMVGEANLSELLSRAKSMGVDVLVVFEVSIKHSERSKKTSNTTRLSIYNVRDGVEIRKGKTLTSTSVAKAREKSSNDDPVELALDVIFSEYADNDMNWRAQKDFPSAVNKDAVAGRIQKLVDSKPENPLPVLVEIKHYHIMDFIDKFEMSNAFTELIGANATKDLIEGSDSAKRKALSKWMPGNFEVGPESSSSGEFR